MWQNITYASAGPVKMEALLLCWMESVSVCARNCLKAPLARLTSVIEIVSKVQDRLLFMKVTGLAGLPGPTAVEGNAPGHVAVTQMVSLELRAEETETAKSTANSKRTKLESFFLILSDTCMAQTKS